ncbi:uncharacterized protein LOC120353120 [Nilaparvata lugens]|uniref:uncharacterized protein LOC120353120 n=1 Tax=Nilaparvata lugens TaxID=108931 RepID=UPI00193CE88D|nr:uncharacterized protein LOC120353120 [Nilaparvata lugens]
MQVAVKGFSFYRRKFSMSSRHSITGALPANLQTCENTDSVQLHNHNEFCKGPTVFAKDNGNFVILSRKYRNCGDEIFQHKRKRRRSSTVIKYWLKSPKTQFTSKEKSKYQMFKHQILEENLNATKIEIELRSEVSAV